MSYIEECSTLEPLEETLAKERMILRKEAEEKEKVEKALKEEEKLRKDKEVQQLKDEFYNNRKELTVVYSIEGNRGRSIKVYNDRVIINTSVTIGSILTSNATDGEKIIFYNDVIGIQYKKPGVTIGYLQLETATGQMNNVSSNQFAENTFTFEKHTEEIEEMKDYIIWQVSKRKQ